MGCWQWKSSTVRLFRYNRSDSMKVRMTWQEGESKWSKLDLDCQYSIHIVTEILPCVLLLQQRHFQYPFSLSKAVATGMYIRQQGVGLASYPGLPHLGKKHLIVFSKPVSQNLGQKDWVRMKPELATGAISVITSGWKQCHGHRNKGVHLWIGLLFKMKF